MDAAAENGNGQVPPAVLESVERGGFRPWDRPTLAIETKARPSRRSLIAATLARPLVRWPLNALTRVLAATPRGAPVGAARWLQPFTFAEPLAALAPKPRDVQIRPVQLRNCRAEWVSAPSLPAAGRAVVYFHGGGFIGCGLNTHRRLVSRISTASAAPVLNVDYRLMPRARIRDAIADGVDAYSRVLEEGVPPEGVVFGGDSSGGHIAFSVALLALERELPRPAGVFGISPWLDLDSNGRRNHPNARLDPVLGVPGMELIVERLVIRNGWLDPRLSPINWDLSGLPPALIQVGSTEVLRVDAEAFTDRLAAAGVPVRLQIWDRQIHDFQLGATPEARSAIEDVGAFVRGAIQIASNEATIAGLKVLSAEESAA